MTSSDAPVVGRAVAARSGPAEPGPRWWGLALPVGVLVAVVGVVVSTRRYGIGLTPDSVTYLVGARGLAHDRGYVDLFGKAITLFPPGYSWVLSVLDRAGIDAIDGARWLAAFSFGVTVVLAWVLLGRHVRSPGVRAGATLLVSLSPTMLEVYTRAVSEHLFIPVVLAFVLVCEELAERTGGRRGAVGWLALMVLLTWAAFSLRYIGLSLLVVGAVVVVLAGWSRGRARALAAAGGFVVAGLAAPAVWMVRNRDATGDPLGPRASSSSSVPQNVWRVAKEIAQWLSTPVGGVLVQVLVATAMAVVVAALVVWLSRRGAARPDGLRRLVPLVVLVGVYLVYLVISASLVAFADIDTRFVVPVFVPLVVLGAWAFEQLRARVPSPGLRTALTVVAVAWIAINGAWFAHRARDYSTNGAGGYANARFHDSELLRAVARLDLDAVPTVTNDPFAIAVLLGERVPLAPAARYFNSSSGTDQLPQFEQAVACAGRVRILWFVPNQRDYLYTPRQLGERLGVRQTERFDDGAIYEVTPRRGVTPACRRAAG